MRTKLLKSILCFGLAGALFFGDAGIALAAEAVNENKVAKTEERNTAEVASIEGIEATQSGEAIRVLFEGYGAKFEIYINDVCVDTYMNYQEKEVYDEETGEYMWVYEAAPYYSSYDHYYIGLQAGASYKVKVIAYTVDEYGLEYTVGATKTAPTIQIPFPDSISVSLYSVGVNEADNKTGYSKFTGINGYVYGQAEYGLLKSYEVQRRLGKSGTWKTVANMGWDNGSWFYDNTATVGKKYYYRVRPYTVKDEYVTTTSKGSWSSLTSITAGAPYMDAGIEYTEEGVEIYGVDMDFVSGYAVYRSKSKTKNFKKIGETSDSKYIDDTVSSGTYYYKVKPFYYDVATKKKIYGDMSNAMGVKLTMGIIYGVQAKQTSTTKAKVRWNAVAGASVYEVYLKSTMAGDAYKYVGTTSKTSYTLKGLDKDQYYYVRIRATKKSNDIKSYYQSASTSFKMGITEPHILGVKKRTVTVTDTKMTVKSTIQWDRVYGADKYIIKAYDEQNDKYVVLKTITKTSTTTYTLTNTRTVEKGWKYSEIIVTAVDGDDEYSAYLYSGITNISCVQKTKVVRKDSRSAKVSWEKSAGADQYEVYRYAPNGTMQYIGISKTNSIVDSSLTPGVKYTYLVSAMNSKFGVSDSSTLSDSENPGDHATYVHKMAKPSISSIKNSSSKKATLTWKKSAYATKYVIYRATSKSGTYKKVGTTKNLTYTDSGLTKGKTYYYKIVAKTVNDAGFEVTSNKSAAKSIKITK